MSWLSSAASNLSHDELQVYLLFPRPISDFNLKAAEKIGRGLAKLKHEVMGKSTDGIADEVDKAYDMAEICKVGHDATHAITHHHRLSFFVQQNDEAASSCSGSLVDIMEYRDLSAWKVKIRKLDIAHDSFGKSHFVFVIEVQRVDAASYHRGNAEDLHWCVNRKFAEFYALESKLTEFHGEFEDIKLPPRSKLFSERSLDVLQGKKEALEDYLQKLLQKPALKGSDILFTFLTSPEELTAAAYNLSIGRMIKNVPIKLTKERGQGLQPFINAFVRSTLQVSNLVLELSALY